MAGVALPGHSQLLGTGPTPQATEAFYSSRQSAGAHELLVVGSDPDPVPPPFLGSSRGSVGPKQAVAGCGVLRVIHRMVTGQKLPRRYWWLAVVFLGAL